MIQTETVKIKGKDFVHTWSDEGYLIERDGTEYAEAYDPAEFGRQYTETDKPAAPEEETTDEEYIEAAKILLGEADDE